MNRLLSGVLGATLYLLVIFGLPTLIAVVLTWFTALTHFLMPVWAAVFLAVLTPFAIIAIRTQVRLSRISLIQLFANSYDLPGGVGGTDKDLASFEFVKGKYLVDLDISPEEAEVSRIPRFPMLMHADWMLIICAVPYMVFAAFGIFILLAPVAEIAAAARIGGWLWPSLLTSGGMDQTILSETDQIDAHHANMLTVVGLAFAGAYFFTIRLFLRAVVTFDLSPVTFLRAFAHMVLAVILAIVVFRSVPSAEAFQQALSALFPPAPMTEGALPGTQAAPATYDPRDGLNPVWLIIAFVFGFIPESALSYVLQRSGLSFKQRHNQLETFTKVIPVTLLDGIDPLIAFRLEEANIYDVQNLAAFNPIMLHIESPFGIYQTIDWVAQAQLCTVVGPERFLALKMLNVRTIFDLRRAVIDEPDPLLLDAIADLLLQDITRDVTLRNTLGMTHRPGLQTCGTGTTPEQRRAATIKLAKVILDDLHVHRLCEIWQHVEQRLRHPATGS